MKKEHSPQLMSVSTQFFSIERHVTVMAYEGKRTFLKNSMLLILWLSDRMLQQFNFRTDRGVASHFFLN